MKLKMKILFSDLMRRTLILLILIITLAELCISAPQRYYNYNYPRYNPYTANLYSRTPQKSRVAYSTTRNNVTYSPNLLADAGVSLASQAQKYREQLRKSRISKSDAQNSKFGGAQNQELEDESERTFGLLYRNPRRRLYSPCGRDASGGSPNTASDPKGQGRFLFDVNVYNVYPNGGFADPCGGVGGGGLLGGAGGLLADALADALTPPPTPLENFLTLFAPGILQNALAATLPPPAQFPVQADTGGLDTDPGVDPAFNPRPLPPVRRPNRVYFDSPGAAPITPAQLIGGVATTVNGIIQQLTGNVQPVYPG